MLRHLIVTIMLLSVFNTVSFAAEKPSVLTQKDFARLILEEFSWNDGLPQNPTDRDYLSILSGKRTFRYEAENAYNPETDRVTLRSFQMFGPFTGKGWLFGVSETTSSNFTILVPIAGEYDFKSVLKGNGFIWNIDGKDYRVDSNSEKFKELNVTKVVLKAGVHSIKLLIPTEGAIDSFSLSASDYSPVKPYSGWRFRENMTALRMAEIAISLRNNYNQLPDAPSTTYPKPLIVADKITLPPTATLTNATYLGSFSSPKWVRADYRGATLQILMNIEEAGFYKLDANVMGDLISGSVNDTPFKLSGKSYLSKLSLGLYRLEAGDNMLTLILPPSGGIDTVEFVKKSSAAADFMVLGGVSGNPDRLIDEKEAITFLKSIHDSVSSRK